MKSVTVKNNEINIIEIKKSKFLAFSYFVKDKEEVLDIIKAHKEKYKDARHNCFGYIIKRNLEEGFSDDGEPGRTAGFPILEYLKNNNYEYTLVIVTRYFGGILLGTGGLSRAYGDSAKMVLEKSGKCRVGQGIKIEFKTDYSNSEMIKYYLEKEKYIIENIKYLDEVIFDILVFEEEFEEFEYKFTKFLGIDKENFKYKLDKTIIRDER